MALTTPKKGPAGRRDTYSHSQQYCPVDGYSNPVQASVPKHRAAHPSLDMVIGASHEMVSPETNQPNHQSNGVEDSFNQNLDSRRVRPPATLVLGLHGKTHFA